MRLLVVEDHLTLAQMTCALLRDVYEHDVEHAATGERALALLGEFRPELALIDLNLPDMDGYELARRMRADPANDAMVLVALTGWGNIVNDDAARAAGFDAQFRKPMNFDLLPTLKRAPV